MPADLIIHLRAKPPTLNINKKILKELINGPDSITFVQEKKKFFLVSKQRPELKLGFIDSEKKEGCLYEISKGQPGILFTDFIFLSLYVFLNITNGFLIHACGIIKDGKGYIFAGPSGNGKSTVASLSRNLAVLSDDRLCIRAKRGSYYMYGVPWGYATINKSVVIKKIFFLNKAKQTTFKRLNTSLAVAEAFCNLSIGLYKQWNIKRMLTAIAKMVAKIPCYEMRFSLSEPFWERIGDLEN
ncbi:MAG: hypothetical protein KJ838_05195 [Candidatus Omnitrophica bacterium]|nr:hypothetical protein [Candidatus Omnitrophota bacterium]